MSRDFEFLCKAAGENVSRETFDRLTHFEQRFRAWNSRINLVASSTLNDLWARHIADSAQLFALRPKAPVWVDLGSGGGFPGLVIAILLKQTGQGIIHLVESNRKKAAFLQAMAGELDLPAHIYAIRIEEAVNRIQNPEIVTARALANLDHLLALAFPWLSAGATALFHKGRDYRAEISESAHNWRFNLIEHPSVVDPESVILEIGTLKKRTNCFETGYNGSKTSYHYDSEPKRRRWQDDDRH